MSESIFAVIQECPHCGSRNLEYHKQWNELHCPDCGAHDYWTGSRQWVGYLGRGKGGRVMPSAQELFRFAIIAALAPTEREEFDRLTPVPFHLLGGSNTTHHQQPSLIEATDPDAARSEAAAFFKVRPEDIDMEEE